MKRIRIPALLNMRPLFLIFLFFIQFTEAFSQQNFYDTDQLPPSFHQQRREKVRAMLTGNSCAVLFSNPVRNRSNDVDFQYFQDPDFFYLTGLNEPNSMLVIYSEPVMFEGVSTNEIIYVQNRDLKKEVWNGRRLGVDGVKSKLGFSTVIESTTLQQHLPVVSEKMKVLVKYPFDINESKSGSGNLNTMVVTMKQHFRDNSIDPSQVGLSRIMSSLREIKSNEELVLMQKAIDMTVDGLNEAIKACRPGMTEYQAQAIVEYFFKKNGSEYPGYGSISGSGINSCVLHYVTNRKTLENGDMLLMDMGAEYHGYTADVTRTIPVNGKFSQEQKLIYELVLKAQQEGIAKAMQGNSFYGPHKAAQAIITQGLIDLGIIKETSEASIYFNHGTSHYLGMEVHDPGNYGPLQPGMVITVEPGIYIPENSKCDRKWWNIGVRIEDDILITDNQPFVMSGKLPSSVVEIEKLMEKESLFNEIK